MTAPRPVVVGIIDDGIAFAHERFRCGDKSRVKFFWMQDGAYRPGTTNVDYGRELTNLAIPGQAYPTREIDDLLTACTHAGAIDEDEVYRRSGLIDFTRVGHKAVTWRIAHGTHVMDLACGYDPGEMRTDRPIVCVQLPARTTANTSGGTLTPYAVDALWYIRDRADEIGRSLGQHPLPVVINFSYGLIGGPHDGTSALEIMMDALIQERRILHRVPLEIVLPSGNSHLSRCHALMKFPRVGASETSNWRVLPDDKTPSFLDIWLPPRSPGPPQPRIKLTVKPPGAAQTLEIDDTTPRIHHWRPNGDTLAWVQYHEYPQPAGRGHFRIILRPTAPIDQPRPLAPAGTWTVTLTNLALGRDEEVHAWIQRDDSLYGYPTRGRQSIFVDEKYQRFDHMGFPQQDDNRSIVKRAGLINAIATGARTVVAAAYVRDDDGPAEYSAGGPTMVPTRPGPTAMSPSEDSRVHGGVLAAGSRSGSVVSMGGTSVAAPQVTRWIADQLADRKPGDRAAVLAKAQQSETMGRPPIPLERLGGGRLPFGPLVNLGRAAPREPGNVGEQEPEAPA